MSILPLVYHPDPRLKKRLADVTEVTPDMVQLARDMLETMYDAPGVGLAAPQVGSTVRLFVADCTGEGEDRAPIICFNPEITWESDEDNTYEEGCLSIPDIYGEVTRPAAVKMAYLDETGARIEREFDGLWATCVQHELDHLDGRLFIDYLSAMRRSMITKKMLKFKRNLDSGT